MVPFSCIDVRIGVPIPFPAPESGASAGLGALPSGVQRRREIDSGAHAEVFRRPFGIVIIPRFSLSLFFAGKVVDVLAGIVQGVEKAVMAVLL